jgi:hypothetical protein
MVWNGTAWQVAGSSENPQTGSQMPWEEMQRLVYQGETYALSIQRAQASRSVFLDLMIHSGKPDLVEPVPARSLDDIAAAPAGIAVAAVDYATLLVQDYSPEALPTGRGNLCRP